ncbi:MAG: HAD family hydrolase [archaeon]|nr:HAD family hydrolase [archaeon]
MPGSNISVFSKLGYDIIGKKKKGNSNNPNNYSMGSMPPLNDSSDSQLQNKHLRNNPLLNVQNNSYNMLNAGKENLSLNKESGDKINKGKVDGLINQDLMQNMIQDLMEITKNQENNKMKIGENSSEDPQNYKQNTPETKNINVDTLKINYEADKTSSKEINPMAESKNTTQPIIDHKNSKPKITVDNDSDLSFNTFLWEKAFYFELHYESKQYLSIAVHLMINELTNKLESKEVKINLFNQNGLNNSYTKLMKILLIVLIYLKFILLDFNYDPTLRAQVKKILNCYNSALLNILNTFILPSENEREEKENESLVKPKMDLPKDFNEILFKIRRIHKLRRINPNNLNLQQFVNNSNKNIDNVIATMKSLSNAYFKIGYFKPLHTIIMDLFRNLETYTPFNFTNLIINHVLFYVIYNNPNDKKKEQLASQSIIFNPTSLLSLYGLNVGTAPVPYLPAVNEDIYTLVLDLDETLVHFFYTPSGGTFLIRPHCFEFLNQMSQIFDIAIFTAAMKEYADGILNLIDKENKLIKYRLYRTHTSINGMCFVKDLSKLGRDLKRVIIIDNLCDNFKLQPNNGLGIKTWTEEIRDTQLIDMGNLLKDIVSKKPEDVRPIIKKVKEEVNKRMKKNMNNPYKNINLDKI